MFNPNIAYSDKKMKIIFDKQTSKVNHETLKQAHRLTAFTGKETRVSQSKEGPHCLNLKDKMSKRKVPLPDRPTISRDEETLVSRGKALVAKEHRLTAYGEKVFIPWSSSSHIKPLTRWLERKLVYNRLTNLLRKNFNEPSYSKQVHSYTMLRLYAGLHTDGWRVITHSNKGVALKLYDQTSTHEGTDCFVEGDIAETILIDKIHGKISSSYKTMESFDKQMAQLDLATRGENQKVDSCLSVLSYNRRKINTNKKSKSKIKLINYSQQYAKPIATEILKGIDNIAEGNEPMILAYSDSEKLDPDNKKKSKKNSPKPTNKRHSEDSAVVSDVDKAYKEHKDKLAKLVELGKERDRLGKQLKAIAAVRLDRIRNETIKVCDNTGNKIPDKRIRLQLLAHLHATGNSFTMMFKSVIGKINEKYKLNLVMDSSNVLSLAKNKVANSFQLVDFQNTIDRKATRQKNKRSSHRNSLTSVGSLNLREPPDVGS